MFNDFESGVIKERQFQRYQMKYSNRETEIMAAIKEHEECIRQEAERDAETDARLEEFRKELNLNGLERALVTRFIDRILVSKDGGIHIIARFGV